MILVGKHWPENLRHVAPTTFLIICPHRGFVKRQNKVRGNIIAWFFIKDLIDSKNKTLLVIEAVLKRNLSSTITYLLSSSLSLHASLDAINRLIIHAAYSRNRCDGWIFTVPIWVEDIHGQLLVINYILPGDTMILYHHHLCLKLQSLLTFILNILLGCVEIGWARQAQY